MAMASAKPFARGFLPSASMTSMRAFWDAEGFLRVDQLLSGTEVAALRAIVTDLLSGKVAGSERHRYDLGCAGGSAAGGVENITQIMWPSDLHRGLAALPLRQRLLDFVRAMMGDPTMDIDYDMVVNKAPHTNTATKFHQDEAYGPVLEDKRALTLWISLDTATVNSGCLFYAPKSHLGELRPHTSEGGGPLHCEGKESECVYLELPPGSACMHAGRTLHCSRGNRTSDQRRAYVINFRSYEAISQERAMGFDHNRGGHRGAEGGGARGGGGGGGSDVGASGSRGGGTAATADVELVVPPIYAEL